MKSIINLNRISNDLCYLCFILFNVLQRLTLLGFYWVAYYSWGFKYHITNKGKNKPFSKVGQGLLNGRLLQSAAMDCTVHCSRLYGPLQRTIQSAAEDCSNPTDKQA